jgi:hypothetical protein
VKTGRPLYCAAALIFQAVKGLIPVNRGLKRAAFETTVSFFDETVSFRPEKGVIRSGIDL